MEEPEDYVSNEKIQGDDIEESSTLISLEATLVITELVEVTDVPPKDSTLISQNSSCD